MADVLVCRYLNLTEDSVLIHALGDNCGDPSGKLLSMKLRRRIKS